VLRDAFEANDFDGFELTLAPDSAAGDQLNGSLNWRKPTGVEKEAAWALALELNDARGQCLGNFSVYRKCSGSPLLVDVNLLIAGFNVALAGALERAIDKSEPGSAAMKPLDAHPMIVVLPEGRAEA